MKTEAAWPRAPYRNDAIFRSAERLLASHPKKTARKLPPRTVVFLVGLVCGVGVTVWLLRPARETGNAVAGAKHVERTRPTLSLVDTKPVPAVTAAAQPADLGELPETPSAAAGSPRTTAVPRPAPAAVPVFPASVSRGATSPAADTITTPATILTRFTTAFKLRGQLRGSYTTPSNVEFELYLVRGPRSSSLQGIVRFIDGPMRVPSFRVAGSWVERTITLSEIVKVTNGTSSTPSPHTFALEFPETDATDEISGSWSYIGLNGTLTLKGVLPL